jgi:hypothetical protein
MPGFVWANDMYVELCPTTLNTISRWPGVIALELAVDRSSLAKMRPDMGHTSRMLDSMTKIDFTHCLCDGSSAPASPEEDFWSYSIEIDLYAHRAWSLTCTVLSVRLPVIFRFLPD